MDRPRLRPIEAIPIERNGQRLLVLRDPSGLSDGATLTPLGVSMIALCDGESTRDEICAEYQRRYKMPLARESLDKLLEQLDNALLLDTDRFRQHSAEIFGAFAKSPARAPFFAGKSYPADAATLTQQLDGYFAPPRGPGLPSEKKRALPRALVSPHIDFNRGGAAYAWVYKTLAEAQETPELVVVFGTNHAASEQPFTLTRKHYETPLGTMQTNLALVDALVDRVKKEVGENAAHQLFYDEHHHRGEHSIEFQMVWLRHIYKERADHMTVLPILCGSLNDFVERNLPPRSDGKLDFFLKTVTELAQGKRTLFIAGADLAHVGPRFGGVDPPLDADDRQSLERRDQETLAAAARGDAAAWFGEIQREKDRRRVCGMPPIFAMLETAKPGQGELILYAQCPADDAGTSLVSIASMVYG